MQKPTKCDVPIRADDAYLVGEIYTL